MKLFIFFLSLLSIFSSCCKKGENTPTECEQNCVLEPQVGFGNAAIPKYYFDSIEKKCKQFIWGGGGGVVPFQTLEECEACGCE